jgi:hypothetical protein
VAQGLTRMEQAMSHDTESMKAAARRTLEEIFPNVDEDALAEVVHPGMVNHDAPPDAPGPRWHDLVHAHARGGVLRRRCYSCWFAAC